MTVFTTTTVIYRTKKFAPVRASNIKPGPQFADTVCVAGWACYSRASAINFCHVGKLASKYTYTTACEDVAKFTCVYYYRQKFDVKGA